MAHRVDVQSVSLRKKLRRWIRRYAILSISTLFNYVPRRGAIQLGRMLGRVIAVVSPTERGNASIRIQRSLQVSESVADKIVRSCATSFGTYVADALRLATMSTRKLREIVTLEGLDHLSNALSEGRGAIILSAHMGNWELLAAALADAGVPLSVIGRRPADSILAQKLGDIRERWGVESLWREQGARPIFRALEAGRAVAALIDQATDVESVQVDFFGQRAWTPIGPALIALKTGAPVVPVHMTEDSDGIYHYTGIIEPEIAPNGDSAESLTQRWTQHIEMWIRVKPESWVWMHDRWRAETAYAWMRREVQ